MSKYFFHLVGGLPAHDVHGHLCASDEEAKDHASFIAHRIAAERPEMAGNFIAIENERHEKVAQVAISS